MIFKTDLNYRKQALLKLLLTVQKKETEIIQALYDDFKKPAFEAVGKQNLPAKNERQ
jgi:aldehyde dehydrogenase (NAD+)